MSNIRQMSHHGDIPAEEGEVSCNGLVLLTNAGRVSQNHHAFEERVVRGKRGGARAKRTAWQLGRTTVPTMCHAVCVKPHPAST